MYREIRILFVEDVPTDLELIKRSLKKNGILFLEKVVETHEDFKREIFSFEPDIVISDYSLPLFDGMQALQLRKEFAPLIPFILVTGSNNEETAVECMKGGADDYILKDNLTRLSPAIEAALKKYEFIRSKKEAEDSLHESEELFRTAFENASIGVYMLNKQGDFINANQTFCDMLGYQKSELMKGKFQDFTYQEDLPSNEQFLKNITTGSVKSLNFEKRFIHKKGYIVWAHLYTTSVFSAKSGVYYYVSYMLDITERKKSEEELLKAKEKAEESDRLKTAFLQNISHEIRTPMNAIVGFSGFLNDPNITNEKRSHFIDIIVQSSNQLLSIITDIITISTIEAGQEKIYQSEVSVNSTIKLVYAQFMHMAEDKGIRFNYKTNLDDYNDRIVTDETKLEAILTNLVGNALKFIKSGSVDFGYTVNATEIKFFVKDTGIGISEEMFGEIFKRFRQVEITESRHFGGSGLGLSISKAYVELLGGKIWLESEPQKGSIFYFTLPFKKSETRTQETIDTKTPEVNKPITVLIAEDEESNSLLLKEMLAGSNFEIIRAVNGVEAVEICRINPEIDLVLMDIKMPKMDGMEATRQIKLFRPSLPVIAQSAYSFPDEKKQAFMAGCELFLSKPIDKTSLLQAISQVITSRLNAV